MKISGHWYSAETSKRHQAELQISGTRYSLMLSGALEAQGLLSDLTFSDRIGDVSRKIYWPDGAMLESADNDLIDQALKSAEHKNAGTHFFHRLENSGRIALLSVIVAIIATVSFFKWGVPLGAKHVAFRLPASANETVSKGTFNTLEKFVFDPSELANSERREITDRFNKLIASLPDQGYDYRLYFRRVKGAPLPNALALPSGQVVVTDSLVEIINDPQELDSILLHEIGHVVERHGIQAVVRGSVVSLIAALVIGDVSGTAELIAALPVFLVQSSYSRESEAEADNFAFAQMVKLGMDPAFFASIIQRLSEPEVTDTGNESGNENQVQSDGQSMSDYFSSHPDSRKRAEKALEFSRQHFKE